MADTQDSGALASGDTAMGNADAVASGSTSTAVDSDWRAALDGDTRKTVEAKNWTTPIDAVKGALQSHSALHRELTEVKSKALVPPSDDAKPEEWSAFFNKLGRPETPEGYAFKLPEGLPENLPYDTKFAEQSKNWFHELGIPQKAGQGLHDKYMQHQAQVIAAHQEAEAKRATEAHQALVKEWGEPKSDTYQRKEELANRTIRQLGGTELISELKTTGALGPNGEVKTPALAKMLAKVGEQLYAEDTVYGGPTAGPNPFSPASENLTEQGKIVASDPDRARVLIRQAGINPKEYGL